MLSTQQARADSSVGAGASAPSLPGASRTGPNLAVRLICPDCREDPPNLVEEYSAGDTICGSCGLVLGDRIVDTRSEWRTFSSDEGGDDPSRVGASSNPLLNGSQLDTNISMRGGGSSNLGLVKAQSKASAVKGEKNLFAAYKEIGAMCEAIALPRVIADIAKQLFKRVDDNRALRGKPQDSIIAACIFIACRQARVPRTFREICNLTRVPIKVIGRVYKTLERMLSEGGALYMPQGVFGVTSQDYSSSTSTSAEDLMVRFCNKLLLPTNVQSVATILAIRTASQGTLAGRSPLSIAASVLYMASYLQGHGKTPREISEVAGVSDSTIRTSYKILYQKRDSIIDSTVIKEGLNPDDVLPRP